MEPKAKYQIGDKVKVIRDLEAEAYDVLSDWVGKVGTITKINEEFDIVRTYTILTQELPPDEAEAWFDESELEAVV